MNTMQIIADQMQALGLSQRDMAQRLRITQPRVSRYLSGKVDCPVSVLDRWLPLLGLTIAAVTVVEIEPSSSPA